MRKILAWVMLLALAGCSVHSRIKSEQDPAFNLGKADPVYLATPDGASIDDRQFFALLRKELPLAGFTLVDDAAAAKWVLVGSIDNSAWMERAQLTFWATRMDYHKQTLVALAAFPAADFAAGRRTAVWSGMSSAKREIYQEYPRSVVKLITNHYGENFDDADTVSRGYEHQQ